jgi:hypothetical protein
MREATPVAKTTVSSTNELMANSYKRRTAMTAFPTILYVFACAGHDPKLYRHMVV